MSGEMWMATALGGRKGHRAMAEPCTMTRMLTPLMMRSWSGKGTSCKGEVHKGVLKGRRNR